MASIGGKATKGRCKVGDKKSFVPAKSPKRTWKGDNETYSLRAYDGRQQAMSWARVGSATGHGKPVNDGTMAIVPDCAPPTSDAWKVSPSRWSGCKYQAK